MLFGKRSREPEIKIDPDKQYDSRALSFFQEWNPTPYFLQEENKG